MNHFTQSKPCTYQEHCKRIARLIREGYHDGKSWIEAASKRYAELEIEEGTVLWLYGGVK